MNLYWNYKQKFCFYFQFIFTVAEIKLTQTDNLMIMTIAWAVKRVNTENVIDKKMNGNLISNMYVTEQWYSHTTFIWVAGKIWFLKIFSGNKILLHKKVTTMNGFEKLDSPNNAFVRSLHIFLSHVVLKLNNFSSTWIRQKLIFLNCSLFRKNQEEA